jgi:very-short-patch-repair endonuclease/predicted transcriptional regulator of viral defense system
MHAADATIAKVAGRQDNVISREQLLAIGVGRGVIARQLERGRWQRLHRNVYLIGPAPPTLRARARAATMTCGEGAAVSHRTAAALYGLMPPRGDVHVTVPGRNPGNRQGVQIHRVTTLSFDEIVVRDGLTLTSPARTICDVAGTEPLTEAERALSEARVQRLVTTRALERVIERTPTLKGSSVIRSLLRASEESGYTRSEAERRLRRLAQAAGIDQPLVNVPLLGFVVDFLWPDQRLVVEVDGYQFHGHRQRFESDRRRDQQLVAAGYRVIRVTWIQLRDEPIAVITSIAQALAIASRATG